MKMTRWVGVVLALFALASCVNLDFGGGSDDEAKDQAQDVGTVFEGLVSNPTGMLQREAEKEGVYCCALSSTLYVVVACETGEIAVEAVGLDGSFRVHVDSSQVSVMISFLVDFDSDGDFDAFEGTLAFESILGPTTQIIAGGGVINLGTITLGATAMEFSDLYSVLLQQLDSDHDGLADYYDNDDDGDGEDDGDECENDQDDNGIPDAVDPYGPQEGNDSDHDGVDDTRDVQIQVRFQLDIGFTYGGYTPGY